MDNRVAGCQPSAGATPLLTFGLPSPSGVVGMVMAPGSASGKHPFYVVCKCGLFGKSGNVKNTRVSLNSLHNSKFGAFGGPMARTA